MKVSPSNQRISSRSFTSVNEIFPPNPFKDAFHRSSKRGKNITVFRATCPNKMKYSKNESLVLNDTPYVTKEKFHALNRNGSNKSVIRSTSTFFYDLDAIAKRHSYHCISELPVLNSDLLKHKNTHLNQHGFKAKSEAIVQECAAQVKPKLKLQDSLKIAAKKLRKGSLNEPTISSEIFLRDNDYINPRSNSIVNQTEDRLLKFWSYAKYRTEYTNPIPEEKKRKKKDRGKRTEDPCPCQLFSYACPCTDKKSLTELARNSKNLTVADQITSTTNFFLEEDLNPSHKYNKTKTCKGSVHHEDKPIKSNVSGLTRKYDMAPVSEEPLNSNINNKEIQNFPDNNFCPKNIIKRECKSHRKSKQIICPNCKEKLEILSATEDEDDLKSRVSPISNVLRAPQDNNAKYKDNFVDERDVCNHNPPCELVPVCQILPTDNLYVNPNCVRRVSLMKNNPKTIRITKACRHHPPCTVVPSCQRLNVLKNNCEYIPPCLHRPRCVNIPLCVPFSKSLNYEELFNKQLDDIDITECNHYPPCNNMSAYPQNSLNNSIDHQFHVSKHTCEYVSEYTPRFILKNKIPRVTPSYSPCQIQVPCRCCKSNKSCQYICSDCKCPTDKIKQSLSSDAVIYIRDVGCQFRSKNLPIKDSLLCSKIPTASFDLMGTNDDSYRNKPHTLRYEDKCTNPISGEELSLSTLTTSSLEIDDQCPSHGRQANKQQTGFSPKSTASPFVAAFSTYTDPILKYCLPISNDVTQETSKSDTTDVQASFNTVPVKSRKSFLKGKHKKVFSIRRRRKSRRNSTVSSRRIPFNQRSIKDM